MAMSVLKRGVIKHSMGWHRTMAWVGGIGLLIFALSGLTHPLMIWTTPRPASFFPPPMHMSAESLQRIPHALKESGITQAQAIRMVPSEQGMILQVTTAKDTPRRYIVPASGEVLPDDYDGTQAVWLARYYTGLKDAHVRDIRLQTTFDDAYPWVNRLLPVYRVTFDTEDQRTVFIHTEFSALAQLTNDWKTSLQTVFRALHTWQWLEFSPIMRVMVMILFLLAIMGMAFTGIAMICTLKRRKMATSRRWHRLIAYGIWLPLLAFSSSGLWHLLQSEYGVKQSGISVDSSQMLNIDALSPNVQWPLHEDNQQVTQMTLVNSPTGELLYRMTLQDTPAKNPLIKQRFDGAPQVTSTYYLDAQTGQPHGMTDGQLAKHYATYYSGIPASRITKAAQIRMFDTEYDFRNKRLPVWRIDYDTPDQHTVFIDVTGGMLVDRLQQQQRIERYVFSWLHKWNMITPWTGRMARDAIISMVVTLAVIFTLLGFVLVIRKRRKRS